MKKILTIFLGTITLISTNTTILIACNTPQEYTKKELKELKEKNKINTVNQKIRENLEWIAPQEKSFNNVDDKYYYVVWRGNKNNNWRIIKFQNSSSATIKIDNFDNRQLEKTDLGMGKDLYITNQSGFVKYVSIWKYDDKTYFKSVYRWNLNNNIPDLYIDYKGNIKVNGE